MLPPRVDPPRGAGERETLTAWLDWHRSTFQERLAALDDEQLRARPVAPSALSLLGLLRHLADVERHWFRRGLAAEDAPPLFYADDNLDGDFHDLDADPPAAVRAAWLTEVLAAQAITNRLGLEYAAGPEGPTLRWVLVHMVEEYARHNGHADLIRESIDGTVGF